MEIHAYAPVISVVAKYAVDWLRKAPWYGFVNAQSKGKVHLLVAALSAVGAVVCGVAFGDLTDASVASALEAVVNAAVAYAGAVAVHEAVKSGKIEDSPPKPE